jgi:hypothetical protein
MAVLTILAAMLLAAPEPPKPPPAQKNALEDLANNKFVPPKRFFPYPAIPHLIIVVSPEIFAANQATRTGCYMAIDATAETIVKGGWISFE